MTITTTTQVKVKSLSEEDSRCIYVLGVMLLLLLLYFTSPPLNTKTASASSSVPTLTSTSSHRSYISPSTDIKSCMHSYDSVPNDNEWSEARKIRLKEKLRGKWIHTAGDSTMRMVYYELVSLLSLSPLFGVAPPDAIVKERFSNRHRNQETRIDADKSDPPRIHHDEEEHQGVEDDIRITFHWKPFIQNITSDLEAILLPTSQSVKSAASSTTSPSSSALPSVSFTSAGLWNVMHDRVGSATAMTSSILASSSRELANQLLTRHDSAWELNGGVKDEVWQRELISRTASIASAEMEEELSAEITATDEPSELIDEMWSFRGTTAGYNDWKPRSPLLVWLSSPSLLEPHLTAHRLANPRFRNTNIRELNEQVRDNYVTHLPMLYVDSMKITEQRPTQHQPVDDGVHSIWASMKMATATAELLECMFS